LRARGVARVVIVGHSLGGLIALRYALDHPQDVAGLVLVNPTSHPRPNDLPWFQRVAGALLGPVAAYTLITPLSLVTNSALTKQLFRPEAAPPDYAAQSGLALAMAPGRFLASLREYAALRDELIRHAPHYPKIAVPTTVIAGESDAIAPPAIHAEALAAALPNASLLRLAGAGHMAHHTHAFVVVRETERLAGWM
jgi:pimeloyl-ACP methyl ester carboxylesterase